MDTTSMFTELSLRKADYTFMIPIWARLISDVNGIAEKFKYSPHISIEQKYCDLSYLCIFR